MSSDDQLLLSVRSDFPDVSALMKVDKNTTFADFRTKVAAELKLKEHVDKYEYSAVAFATDVLSLPADEKSLTSSLSALGVRSRSTILLYAPSELRPVRKLPSKKDKKKAKARKPLDDVFAGFTPKNIIKKLESGTLGTKKEKLAKEFIDIYAEDVVKSPAFLEAKLSTVEGIASSNTLNIPEGELFAGVVNWARAECKRQDTTDLKSVLTTVLPHIRFPQMSTQDVATKVSPTGLLTDTQVLEIFTYLGAAQSTKDPSNLPRISWPAMPRKARKPRNWFTWNPEKKTANLQLADENTTVVSTVQSWQSVFGNTELVKGVYEFNIVLEQYDTSNSFNVAVGVVPVSDTGYNSGTLIGYSGQQGWAFITGTGATCNQASPVNSSVGACKQGDTICTRVDLDQNTIEWIVNPGQGERTTGVIYRNVNGPVLPAVSVIGNSRVKLEFPRFRNL